MMLSRDSFSASTVTLACAPRSARLRPQRFFGALARCTNLREACGFSESIIDQEKVTKSHHCLMEYRFL